ncbi:MAG TPA: peptidoglycan bridge formation glycyltransferase FemA/FemB family protein [Candidatus Nanoarchaeia archaeon]|nr:peptidoglycan bridge formation glycyltransferase FemA/FemB family protein [Candidatus Nanoarchaeia archaeon]
MNLSEITDPAEWDAFVESHEYGHPLQLWAWGELKRHNGWRAVRLRSGEFGAQVLFFPIPKTRKTVAYVPRGPLCVSSARPTMALLSALTNYAKEQGAVYLKIEPAWTSADMPADWKPAKEEILLSKTYTINLNKSADELMAAMRSKTRQYIRQAERNDVEIELVTSQGDLSDFWRVYRDTAQRAGFGLHALDYYRKLHEFYGQNSHLYYAKVDGKVEAFLWVINGAGVALELYGGVTHIGGETKANYLLKWEAIRRAQQDGQKLYDFSGRLNEGVSQFKAGFGPDETNYVGSYDKVLKPLDYMAWTMLLPALKPLGRRFLKRGIVK